MRPDARSRNTPIGLPARSLRISPPGGLCVFLVMPASSIAFALAMVACPLAWVRSTGLFGAALLSSSCVGKPSTAPAGTRSHFSWCHPRPRIHSPGCAFFAASATIATISSQLRAFISSRFSLASPTPMKCAWLSVNAGIANRPARSMTSVFWPM